MKIVKWVPKLFLKLTTNPKIASKSKKQSKQGQFENKKMGMYCLNQSLQSTYLGLNKYFEPDFNPKNGLEGSKTTPNVAESKAKRQDCTSKPSLIVAFLNQSLKMAKLNTSTLQVLSLYQYIRIFLESNHILKKRPTGP